MVISRDFNFKKGDIIIVNDGELELTVNRVTMDEMSVDCGREYEIRSMRTFRFYDYLSLVYRPGKNSRKGKTTIRFYCPLDSCHIVRANIKHTIKRASTPQVFLSTNSQNS